MSRAINLQMPEKDVHARCASEGISISAIEPLPLGGTHVVCTTGAGADQLRLLLEAYIIEGVVQRTPFYRTSDPL